MGLAGRTGMWMKCHKDLDVIIMAMEMDEYWMVERYQNIVTHSENYRCHNWNQRVHSSLDCCRGTTKRGAILNVFFFNLIFRENN